MHACDMLDTYELPDALYGSGIKPAALHRPVGSSLLGAIADVA
ncbi:hypothetical protein ATJ78_1136 [Paramicrobacterium agarici]|uniref:Uncharacterized protein n=1 Tax=Paramicrobacterium agarici TaxID=630514 RepID=A0A2A9DV36_9MICO|nr:hypothetical protein ATJ78_1136 [Microbacterium agarici]